MAKTRSRTFKSLALFLLAVILSLAVRHWFFPDEVILIDGKQASVIDGDSFRIGEDEFRIYGIDAPEYRQSCLRSNGSEWACGKAARDGLDRQLRGQKFSCDVHAKDQFGRTIVTCLNEKELDLGSSLVAQGFAVSSRHFDEIVYAAEESGAKNAKRGIWQGEFKRPDEWRASNPR